MKPKNLLLTIIVAGLFASCASVSTFYQVYKTSNDGLKKDDNANTYEDEYCQVSYNLWSDGGNAGFRFYNKTDKNIYLNLDECFYVLNGNAHNYYRNRVRTYSAGTGASVSSGASGTKSVGASTSISGINYFSFLQTNSLEAGASQSAFSSSGIMASKGFSIAYLEDKVICIPSKTSKVITEYSINETPYRDCYLLRFPSRKQTAVQTFDKSNSPFVFSNRIAYKVGQNDSLRRIENAFYVNEISNICEDKMLIKKTEENCGEKALEKTYFFKEVNADDFYIRYTRPSSYKWSY